MGYESRTSGKMSLSFDSNKAVEVYTEKTELFPIEKQIFEEYLSQGSLNILDLGCGTGRTTKPLAELGHTVYGVDISPNMIAKAKELHPDIWFEVGTATSLNFKSNMFDVVLFSFNGLDYLYPEDERLKAINEIHRVLIPGGLFVFSSHDLSATHNRKRNWKRRPKHFKGFYFKENAVYGELITYYGARGRNINNLITCGFVDPQYYSPDGKGWRYYVARKLQ